MSRELAASTNNLNQNAVIQQVTKKRDKYFTPKTTMKVLARDRDKAAEERYT